MPFYHRLKVRDQDSPEQAAEKKRVAGTLLKLREALEQHIHDAADCECDDSSTWLRLATWNIREFDSTKYGQRLEESFHYIAEIISAFDIVALQEVREDLDALKSVMRILRRDWTYIATDVTAGQSGNRERMVFVYNTKKVWFRNVVGEVVLPKHDRIQFPFEERLKFKNQKNSNAILFVAGPWATREALRRRGQVHSAPRRFVLPVSACQGMQPKTLL